MDREANVSRSNYKQDEEELNMELRRGPWTVDEDFKLINYVARHGDGRWNSLARCAGLKRTGKSCRLRWLNYLRPDVRRGNITLEEQLLILELHSRWGNRWSKIAQHLPGRTDNEIKNYWRTRVQKHAKQLKCDVDSKQFKDTVRYLWMPRLLERIQAAAADVGTAVPLPPSSSSCTTASNLDMGPAQLVQTPRPFINDGGVHNYTSDNSSLDSFGPNNVCSFGDQTLASPTGYFNQGLDLVDQSSSQWMDGGDGSDSLWNVDDLWFLHQQFNSSS